MDAVNITDNPAAHAHASNVSMAIAVKQLGVEPIMQVVCRDKNRLAAQADVVGASMHGVTISAHSPATMSLRATNPKRGESSI